MNRYREDTPYVFRPPRYSNFWAPIIYAVSDMLFLRRRDHIVSVKVMRGGDELLKLYREGHSLLITPNHSDHADPHVLMHLSRRYRIPVHFMAAREIFEKIYGLQGAALQRAGVFSIDREGSDLKSIKEAMRILNEGRFPLVMFPEGEIYHLNEKLTPLNEGAATIGLRSARNMAQNAPGKRACIVPTAIRYSYVDDISDSFDSRMARLEQHILWAPQSHLDIIERIYKFGEALLSLKEKELLDCTLEGSLPERLAAFRERLLAEEETRYFSEPSRGLHPARIRRLRGKIRTILLAEEKPTPEVLAQCYRSLDRIYVVIQLYSYPGQYLRHKPSMDRIAETIHKFEEDIFNENPTHGRRTAEVNFCAPVNLMDYLERARKESKAVASEITALIEARIREVLEG